MSSLKKKTKRKRERVKTTLDAEHKKRNDDFAKRKTTIEMKKTRLKQLKREVEILRCKNDEK